VNLQFIGFLLTTLMAEQLTYVPHVWVVWSSNPTLAKSYTWHCKLVNASA